MRFASPIVSGLLLLSSALITGCGAEPGAPADERVAAATQASTALPKQTISLSTGITMKYLEAGSPGGEVVILLHGYTDTSRSFHPTMQHLAAERPDLHIFALDQRGHGGTSMPSPAACKTAPEQCFRPADFAADVLAFMDAKGIAKASIVGHSMGSVIAQELALSAPQRIDRVVLIGTSGNLVDNVVLRDYLLAEPIEGSWKASIEAQGYTWPDDAYELTPLDADPNAEAWMAANWVADPVADPAFIADIVPETSRIPLGTWLGAAKALLATDNRARLEQLTVPSFVIWASQDAIFYESPDQEELIAALDVAADHCRASYWWKQYGAKPLPASGFQEDDIGHNVQWGAPAEVAADVARYLRGGVPTLDLFQADPNDPQSIVTQHGQAPVVHGPKQHCGAK